jgi:hypothetical protein
MTPAFLVDRRAVRDFGDGQPRRAHAGKITLGRMVLASRAAVTWSSTHTDFQP